MDDVTSILEKVSAGDPKATERLLPLIYDELRALAANKLSQERPGHTLQATALVHEAYLRLVTGASTSSWDSRRHFFAAAAEAMRRILIDVARQKTSQKRGGDWQRVTLENFDVANHERMEKLMAVDQAVTLFEEAYPDKAELVKLRFFVGLSIQDAAKAMGISIATANRSWAFAKAWLQREMKESEE